MLVFCITDSDKHHQSFITFCRLFVILQLQAVIHFNAGVADTVVVRLLFREKLSVQWVDYIIKGWMSLIEKLVFMKHWMWVYRGFYQYVLPSGHKLIWLLPLWWTRDKQRGACILYTASSSCGAAVVDWANERLGVVLLKQRLVLSPTPVIVSFWLFQIFVCFLS